jgi:hypothetical protein
MSPFFSLGLLACCLLPSACASESQSAAPLGAGDGGEGAAGGIGRSCADDSDCTGLCLRSDPFTGGYCTRAIAECPAPGGGPGSCPSGSTCANGVLYDGGAGDYCLADCASNSECRATEGYTCCPGLTHAGRSVCAPARYCSPH